MKFWILVLALFSLEATPAQVLIIRHAEKPAEGIHLDQRGWERAYALAPFFKGRPEVLEFGPPVAIFAMGQSHEDSSLRPQETVQEIGKIFNIRPITQYTKKQSEELVKEILSNPAYEGKSVLICWEHKAIAEIVEKFGAHPPKWHGSVFDRVYKLVFRGSAVDFYDLPQRLLFDDSPH